MPQETGFEGIDVPVLEGADVVLRPWIAHDVPDLHREIQDPEIVRWMSIELPYTLQDAESFVAKAQQRPAPGEPVHFVIAAADDDRFLGYLGVLPVDGWKQIELVYWIAVSARRKGAASDALTLAVDWAQRQLRPELIELGMARGNSASAGVARRCGFVHHETRPGTASLHGRSADEDIFRWRPPPAGGEG